MCLLPILKKFLFFPLKICSSVSNSFSFIWIAYVFQFEACTFPLLLNQFSILIKHEPCFFCFCFCFLSYYVLFRWLVYENLLYPELKMDSQVLHTCWVRTCGVGSREMCFSQALRWLRGTLMFENHCLSRVFKFYFLYLST